MKTLVVLTALAAVALAGPTFRAGDAEIDATKIGKRSPTLHHHHIATPVHIAPVHHSYVQPVIPHHLGLKKPLIVQPYGHHGHHLFRSDDEQLETHSAESKESKSKCMKEMEAKCDDDVIAKSSELEDSTKIEDIDGNVSNKKVAQSLQMAQEAVDMLRKHLEESQKNSKAITVPFKYEETEAERRMQADLAAAKLALERMQFNFGNLESMNVHAREFKNAEVHDVNLKLKSDEERLAQWKNAIENIQKNVEVVRNIEDSFQHDELSEKSAALEKSSTLKHEMSEDHKLATMHNENSGKSVALDTTMSFKHEISNNQKHDALALKEEKTSSKNSDTMMARDMETKSTDGKSSLKAREHEQSEMETSASTLSKSKSSLHSANEQKSFRSESNLEKSSDMDSASSAKLTAEHDNMKGFKDNERSVKITEDKKISKSMETISQPSLKSSANLDMKQTHLKKEKMASVVDTTTLMKSAEHNQAQQLSKTAQHSTAASLSHEEHGMSSQSANEHSSHKEHQMRSQFEQHKSSNSALHGQELNQQRDNLKAKESETLNHHELSNTMNSKDAHEMMMKSSDQMTGQSQQSAVAVKAEHVTGHQSEKLHHTSHGAHGKSAENGLFAPIEMPAFKQSLVPSRSWKEVQSARGAYGSGLALGGGSSAGYGAGSGAVGVFPNARVGGCAIPLLLSCSPSVVAGSLAKSHSYAAPSYAASGYRSENTNTHSKRDITKISHPYKVKRTPKNKDLKEKTILITDKL